MHAKVDPSPRDPTGPGDAGSVHGQQGVLRDVGTMLPHEAGGIDVHEQGHSCVHAGRPVLNLRGAQTGAWSHMTWSLEHDAELSCHGTQCVHSVRFKLKDVAVGLPGPSG